jgi:RimJ/RimL family protein N-acetyltransferase
MNAIKFHYIETDRLKLRKFKEKDTKSFLSYRTNPQVALYQGERWINYKMEDAEEFVKEQMNSKPGLPDGWFQIAIQLKDTGNLIGDLAIHTLLEDTKQVEIGFTLNPMYQKKGHGIEAVEGLIDYIFKEMKMHRIIAITDVRNDSSINLLKKIGMRKEGHFIESTWNKGEYTDEYLFALLNQEWLD